MKEPARRVLRMTGLSDRLIAMMQELCAANRRPAIDGPSKSAQITIY
jgi:hypothetical protein